MPLLGAVTQFALIRSCHLEKVLTQVLVKKPRGVKGEVVLVGVMLLLLLVLMTVLMVKWFSIIDEDRRLD